MKILKKIACFFLIASFIFTGSFNLPVKAASSEKEVRGLIVKTFDNEDFPSKPGLTEAEIKAEAAQIITNAKNYGLNSVFIDIKPMSEVLYKSELYPSSYFLTGGQYRNLSFDLLTYLIDTGKSSGIDIYVYMSSAKAAKTVSGTTLNETIMAPFKDPLFDYTSAELKALQGQYNWKNVLSTSNPALIHPDWLVKSGDYNYFDIGIPEVRTLIANTAAELAKYPVKGILLGSDFYPTADFDDNKSHDQYNKKSDIDTFRKDNITALVKEVSDSVSKVGGTAALGISPKDIFAGTASSEKYIDIASIIANKSVDFIMPEITFDGSNENLTAQYEHWNSLTASSGIKVIYGTNLDALAYDGADSDPYAINYQIALARNNNSAGHVFTDYQKLKANPLNFIKTLQTSYSDAYIVRDNMSFSISQKLNITRPSEDTYLSESKYFIMGTSDPSKPLYINGTEITNRSESGTFGYMVTLNQNVQTITATQGNSSVSRTITKPSVTSTTTVITQSSMFPAVDDYYLSGETMTLKCVAPSGASVSATINGVTVSLKQAAATSKNGIPATFKADYTVPAISSEIKNFGKITYTLNYGGKTTTYQSTGQMYLGKAGSTPAIKVVTDIGNVFTEANSDSDFHSALRLNAVTYAVGKEGSYFKLKMGGYIPKSSVDILEGSPDLTNKVTATSWKTDEKSNTLVVSGTKKAAFSATQTSSQLTVILYDTINVPAISAENSTMFSTVNVAQSGSNTVLTFTPKDGQTIYGYNVEYDKNNIDIYCRKKPVLSGNAASPLSGITIMLDPGHGGYDPGALGPTGAIGPTESQMTLAAAYAAKNELEAMGAKVYLTRTNDSRLDFPERMNLAQIVKPDLFISVHYNSTVVTTDSSKTSGTEAYYFNNGSKSLATNIMTYVANYNNRDIRKAMQASYRVTRLPFTQATLVELGFLPNPIEYDGMTKTSTIKTTGKAIAAGILAELK